MAVFSTEPAAESDITLACSRCGALRRVPIAGELLVSRLDDLSAEGIAARTRPSA